MFKIILAIEKDHLEIVGDQESRLRGDNFAKLLCCPDRKRFKDNRFIFFNCSLNVDYFIKCFPDAKWEGDAEKIKEEYYKRKELETNLVEDKKENYTIENCDFNFKTKPFDHQLKAFIISRNLEEYALLFQQRTGKTKTILDTAAYLYQKNKINSLIVVAPNGVHRDWIDEAIPQHMACETDCFIWSGKWNKKEQENFNQISLSNKLQVYSFNIDCFVGEKQQELLKSILKNQKCLLVIDESHKIKNPSAKRTKFLISVSKMALYRRILTGTPIANGPQDIYSQFMFLNSQILGLTSFFAFKIRYCVMGGYEGKQIIGSKNLDELQNKIDQYSFRVLKKDCFDLPEKIYQKIRFDLTTEQRKIYNDVKEEGMAFLKDKNVDDPLIFNEAITRITKMQQIISGFIYDTDGQTMIKLVEDDKNPKLQELTDLLNRIEGKTIIWTKFVFDADIICNYLKESCVRYDGKIDGEQRQINKQRFKQEEKIKYIVINSQVGAEGITLPEAENAIFFTNGYSFLNRDQAEARNHDVNSKKAVTYFDMCCNNSIDSKIIRILRDKKKFSEIMLKDPRSILEGELE